MKALGKMTRIIKKLPSNIFASYRAMPHTVIGIIFIIIISSDLCASKGGFSKPHTPSHPHVGTNSHPGADHHAPKSSSGRSFATGALIGAGSAATIGALASHHRHGDRPSRQLNSEKTIVDLSHPLHNGTLHWPTFGDVNYSITTDGERQTKQGDSYYLKADSLSSAIHSGTHMDAPRHFSKTGWTVEQIPLDRLIDVPLTVIDVSAKVSANRTYSFVKEDFLKRDSKESLVQANSVVLVYTGISKLYDQGKEAYLGTNSSDIGAMKIPGFSAEAAEYMVERGVYGVGIDSLSADSSERHGSDGLDSFNPVAHKILTAKNIYIIENISKNLADLVNVQGARLTTAPLPIVGGSGSQVRVVAILGHDDNHCEQMPWLRNSGESQHQYSYLAFITSMALFLAFLI